MSQSYERRRERLRSVRYPTTAPVANPIQRLALPPSNAAFTVQQYCVSPTDFALVRDLEVAVQSLRQIESEMSNKIEPRPKGQRSASFTRYVIDEEESVVLDPIFKKKIMEIEDIYARWG